MITLWRVNYLVPEKPYTIDRVAWVWVDDSEDDDFVEWSADDIIHAQPLLRVGSIEDIGAIADASRRQYNDHFEPDAVNTPDGWRVI